MTRALTPALVFVLATLGVLMAVRPYLVGVYHDDGVYALLAHSIAGGTGFHYLHLPGEPAAVHYPPLYPLVLAAVTRVTSSSASSLVYLNAPLAGAAALGWWQLARKRLAVREVVAGVLAVLCVLTLPTLVLASAVLSETLFLAALFPVLVLAERLAEHESSAVSLCGAGAAIGALMLVRTHAVAALIALLLVLATQRRWRDVALVAAAAIGVQLPWLVWTSYAAPKVALPLEGSYGSYLGWFATGLREGGAGFVVRTIERNALESWLYLHDRFAAGFPGGLNAFSLGVIVVALVAGMARLFARARVTMMFVVVYFGIILVWPYTPWRFVYAVWPLVLLIIVSGVLQMYQLSARGRPYVVALMLLPALAFLRVQLHDVARRAWRAPSTAASAQILPLVRWTREHTQPGDVLLAEGEPALALNAERMAAPPIAFTAREYLDPPTTTEATVRLQAMLHAVPAQWVMIMSPAMSQAAAALGDAHPGLRPAAQLATGTVFRVVP